MRTVVHEPRTTVESSLTRVISNLLQDLVCDHHLEVCREAVSALSQACFVSNRSGMMGDMRHDFIVSLLTLHGGRGQCELGDRKDREFVYNILDGARLSTFAMFCTVVTFFENRLHRMCHMTEHGGGGGGKEEEDGHTAGSRDDGDDKRMVQCVRSVRTRHSHFDSLLQLSMRTNLHMPRR